ncbi:MAG: dihydroneopterin aldolase [Chloroflexi bacterium]|nr:dihydroneopterin aldolase [Chloroflexota bacterium]
MTDSIFIHKASFECHIGITPAERATPQEVVIDVDLAIDLSAAGRSDSIKDTLDYRGVWELLNDCVVGKEFHLVEALSTKVGDVLLANYPSIDSVTVGVTKPAALAAKGVGSVGVRLTVTREQA